jgi:chromate reductase
MSNDAVQVLAFPGSLRTGAFTTRMLDELLRIAPPELSMERFEGLEQLPYFNQDVEGVDEAPESVRTLRQAVTDADVLLIVTPEYNRSAPATIKNLIDWCSRPHGEGVLTGKPVAVVTASPGPSGGLLAFHHIRQMVHAAGATPIGSKEFAIPGIYRAFDESGAFADEMVRGWLHALLGEIREHAATRAGALR